MSLIDEQIQIFREESAQRQHYDQMQHQDKMTDLYDKSRYELISILGLKPQKDGNQWCYLYGDNLQEGIAGFGDSIYDAMIDFYKEFHKPIKE